MSLETLLLAGASSLPVAAVGWAGASLTERLGADTTLRCRVWSAALWAGALATAYVLVVDAVGLTSPLALFGRAAEVPFMAPGGPTAAIPLAPSMVAGEAPPATASWRPTWPLALSILWTGGAALRITLLAGRIAHLRRRLEQSRPFAEGVRLYDGPTPILAGWRKPAILIPEALAERLDAKAVDMICRHERAHLQRGDHHRIVTEELLMCLFWFNPLMALMRRRLTDAREEACDAVAIGTEEPSARRAYARILVESLRGATKTAPLLAFTGGRRAAARRRIEAILKGQCAAGFAAAPAGAAAMLAAFLAAWFFPVALAASPAKVTAAPAPLQGPVAEAPVSAPQNLSPTQYLVPSSPGPIAPAAVAQSPQRPAPVDYAKPSAQRPLPSVEPLRFDCILTNEGRATGCKSADPEREPERSRAAIAEIEGRAWPVGVISQPTFAVRTGGRVESGVTRIDPGPMTAILHADGRITGGGRRTFVATSQTSPELEAMIARNTAHLERTRPTSPAALRDEAGRTVGSLRWLSDRGLVYSLTQPVTLRLDGRPAGELEADANGKLWLSGRQTADRGTPIPVRDKDNVLRMRKDLRALQPGDIALFNFAPILEMPLAAAPSRAR